MKVPVTVTSVALAIALSAGMPAVAGLSQASITSPGGFVQAGAYQSTCGCWAIPGSDMTVTYGLGQDFHEQGFSGDSAAQQSASASNGTITNSASGTSAMGRIRMQAANTSPNTALFAAGIANGGWKETFTVGHPTLNGQAGFVVFQIRVRGSMQTTGATGLAKLVTTGYRNGTELAQNALFNRGDSDAIVTDRQRAEWGVVSVGQPNSRAVDSTVTMSVPITFGQSFTLGVDAIGFAGQRASGSATGSSTGILDFSGPGVEWGGITSVQSGGAPITGYTIVSGTGIDWSLPLDQDGDGVANALDCAPLDPGAFASPGEVTGDLFGIDNQTYSWISAVASAGAATVHDVVRGELRQLPVGSGGAETCLAPGLPGDSVADPSTPDAGGGFYYLVRGRNACGTGTYGFATGGAERVASICP